MAEKMGFEHGLGYLIRGNDTGYNSWTIDNRQILEEALSRFRMEVHSDHTLHISRTD